MTLSANTISTFLAGPFSPLGIAGLIKNWWQVRISIPSLGVGIQGIGPAAPPDAHHRGAVAAACTAGC